MSKLSEYIALIPKALPNTMEIVSGIVKGVEMKYNTLPEGERAEIIKRRLTCKGCPFNSENAKTSEEYKELTGKPYITKRKEEHCSFCGCNINMRTASLSSSCGVETWNKNNPDKQLPLKWTIYGQGDKNKESSD